MHSVLHRVLAEYPRFRASLVPSPEAEEVTLEELATPERLNRAIAASEALFPMGNSRWAGQVWWFSWNNSILAPAVTALVEFDVAPSLELGKGVLHAQPGDYWYCYSTDIVAGQGQWRAVAQGYAQSVSPLIDALASVAGIKPAPLWAVTADAFVSAAVSAGNEMFDPYRGVRIACELSQGLDLGATGVKIPTPRFQDIVDGQIFPTNMDAVFAGEEPDDVHTVARRASCCMIYHSPECGKCLSCPKQEPAVREAALIAYVQ